MKLKGIDVSVWQGNINWQKVKDNIDFAILRIGHTTKKKSRAKAIDSKFERNYNEAKKYGIPVGVYWYSCATTIEQSIIEANKVLEYLKGRKLEYPIYFDTEDNHDISDNSNYHESQASIGKERLTKVVKAFCETIENAGYYVGIYASLNWFQTKLNDNELQQYDHWVAQWSDSCTYKGKYGLWQYSSKGRVDGISGNVDMNYAYKDYPIIMIEKGLNGYSNGADTIPNEDNTKLSINDLVLFTGNLYRNSYGEGKGATRTNCLCKITNINMEGSKPYHLFGIDENVDLGWVDKEEIQIYNDIVRQQVEKGDKVIVINPINYDNGKKFEVYYNTYDVIEVKGNRAVIGIGNIVTSAIDIKNIKKD